MDLEFRALDEHNAREILRWSYPPPLDFYNAAEGDTRALATLLDPAQRYFAALASGDLAGFCCFGADARVPGGDYADEALDVGAGLRPELIGRGMGRAFVGAVIAFGSGLTRCGLLRATIAAFNTRALRVVAAHGFTESRRFRRADGVEFVMLVRAARSPQSKGSLA